jgi:CRISPR system Cascade subunit CasA
MNNYLKQDTGFNLLKNPWIPLLDHDGRVEEYSIMDTFALAGEHRAICGEVPTQEFAILRLLLAIMHRSLKDPSTELAGPTSYEDWKYWNNHWDDLLETVNAYLDQFQERFDILDSEKPFYQVAGLRTAKNEIVELKKIIIEVPDREPFFTTRLKKGISTLAFSEAARWLIHVQAYDVSGIKSGAVGDPTVKGSKGYPIGPGWLGSIGGFFARASTLKETLLMNLLPLNSTENEIVSTQEDLPPWEMPQLGPECITKEPHGPIELYTWQSRRVRLIHNGQEITGCILCRGDKIESKNRQKVEPFTAYKYSDKKTKELKIGDIYFPQIHEPSKSFWRGLSSLLPFVSDVKGFIPPKIVGWCAKLERDDISSLISNRLKLCSVGIAYGTQQAFVADMVYDDFELSINLLHNANLAQVAIEAVGVSDAAVRALGKLAFNIGCAAGSASKEAEIIRTTTQASVYNILDRPFRHWLANLSNIDTAEDWYSIARNIIWKRSREIVSTAPLSAWGGRIVNNRHIDVPLADIYFKNELAKVLPNKKVGDI